MFDLHDVARLWWLQCCLVVLGVVVYYIGALVGRCLAPTTFGKLSRGSQYYVVANIWKALVLTWIALQPEWWTTAFDVFSTHGSSHVDGCMEERAALAMDAARKFIVVYVSCDISQFALVPMRVDTIVHHGVTALYAAYASTMPSLGYLARTLGWFGMCSTLACFVNLYLGLRKVWPTDTPNQRKGLAKICGVAFVTYVLELTINWPVFLWFVYKYATHASAVLGLAFSAMALGLMVPEAMLVWSMWQQYRTLSSV